VKKIILLSLGLSLISGLASAKPEALIQNVYGRQAESLNGEWMTIADPTGTEKWKSGRQKYQEDNGYYRNPTTLIEYDFDRALPLAVPGDWNSQKEMFLYYEGAMWYRKAFQARVAEGTRSFLYFGAVNYEARVFFNAKEIGVHEGGFTPFNYEVTGLVKENNSLVVRVDDTRKTSNVPTTDFDWWNYGGITRDVMLVTVPETFIRDYSLSLDKSVPGLINGYVQLDGKQAEQNIVVSIPELKVNLKLRTDAKGHVTFSTQMKKKNGLQLWCPENPKLYSVAISSETDKIEDRIGFRTISTEGTKILLNGKPIFLKGVAIHEENISKNPGRVRSAEEAKALLDLAKEMNCNFVRLAHYPHSEAMVRQAEEMGLMVWDEIPCYWNIDWNNKATYTCAEQQLEEMISRDKNRAGVIIWSVANETPQGEQRMKFLTSLISHTRELDGTRLVSAALLPSKGKDNYTKLVNDPLGEYVDILSYNYYLGWYNGRPEDGKKWSWSYSVEKPVVITEFGGGALLGFHGEKNQYFTEEYLVEIYKANLEMFDRIPQVAGIDPWLLKDFRSPKRPLAGLQDFYNRKGLTSENGEKKQAFYIMQEYYKNK